MNGSRAELTVTAYIYAIEKTISTLFGDLDINLPENVALS
ncbi:hypothetical protein XBO1_2520019 [Xenorhabdus bovienii str. oregonense]|uniref:Uncharacterized protein n=1 Tax=Xenorhabdus bovienii str. oregonense TaxID=1398202 RepID=A0A077P8V2_XENBV|nr:hypothetical protein XBO1_2520019 [Xenorhabdus bovienii str. oregonense]